jgi:DNA-binding response OmpR family regulator
VVALANVLIVDDDEDNLEMFSQMLINEGFSVDGFTDAATALFRFKPDFYDLVILDYLLPSLNGLQLYNKLREKDESIKAVFLTASQDLLEVENSNEVIKKPIYPTKLVEKIRKILNSGNAKSMLQSGN